MTERHPPAASLDAPTLDRRTVTVLLTAVVLLIVFEYWGLAGAFKGWFKSRDLPAMPEKTFHERMKKKAK